MSVVKITVLMTVYNGEKYLRPTIKSILTQTYNNFEFLIIDDTSTDSSIDIINSFQDQRIHIVCNEQNMGQTRSLNKGLQLAKGQYVARMDADDMAFPHWLEGQINFIEKNPEYVVVGANAVIINSENQTIKILNSPELFEDIILKSLIACPVNHVGALYCKDIILKYGGYDESFKIAEDYDLWSKLIREGYKLTRTKDISIAIRFHDASTSIAERGKSDIVEISHVMYANIRAFTNQKIDAEDSQLLWKFIYDVDALSKEKFYQAKDILVGVYNNLKPDFKSSSSVAKVKLRALLQIVYVKRIFGLIKQKDIKQVRLLASQYLESYGIVNFVAFVWFFSLFGSVFLIRLEKLYEEVSKQKAKIRLKKLKIEYVK